MDSPHENGTYAFDDICVDPRRFRVTRNGVPVPLEPRAFDLLVLLIESGGDVVTKKDIFERLWSDTAVTDNALTRIVAQLRKALGDDARASKYIETVPTRGYRWLAEVRREAAASATAGDSEAVSQPRRRWQRALNVAGAAAVAAVFLALVALTRGNAGMTTASAPITMRAVQLTTSPALDAFPALSPDGTLMAYASSRGGAFEILVREVTGSAAERALTADGQQNVQPAWSPDGAFIAYHSRRRGGIWTVSALGGAPRQVSAFGSHPAWSPDGSRLAFQSDPFTDITPTGYAANVPSTIWVAGRDGAGARALTKSTVPLGAHGLPIWSPGGERVVFVSAAAGAPRVWTVDAAGGEPAAVEGLIGARDLSFTPDGRTLYAATGEPGLVRIDVSTTTGLAAGRPQRILVPGVSSIRHVSVAPDGRTLAFTGMDLTSQLWTMAIAGGAAAAATRLTDDRATRQTEPAFSPDGKALAFWSLRPGAGGDIWMVDAAGGRPSPVTARDGLFNPALYTRPSWLPGGRRLAFISHEDPLIRSIAIDLESRRESTLLEVRATGAQTSAYAFTARDLTIAPDGTRAAYSQFDPATGRQRLFVRSLGDPDARTVTSGDASERYPVWSPDSRSLAFEQKLDAATNIAIVPADGGQPRQVTSAGENWPYTWSPDGGKIVFAALRDGLWNLWWVSLTTGETRQLTRYDAANVFVRYPAWSPSGDRIAFELGTVTGNIWAAPVPR